MGSPQIGLDMFVFNVDAGAERGHLSYHGPNPVHEGWSVHWKMATPDGMHQSESWEWPDSMPQSDGRCTRFACVIIPRAALEPYPPGPKSKSEPVLLEAPGECHQINVDIFFEAGESFTDRTWPGKTSKGTRFVGHRIVSIHAADQPPKVIGRWVLVAHTAPQGELLNTGEMTIPASAEMLDTFENAPPVERPRLVMFGMKELDGGRVPWLTELPVTSITASRHE